MSNLVVKKGPMSHGKMAKRRVTVRPRGELRQDQEASYGQTKRRVTVWTKRRVTVRPRGELRQDQQASYSQTTWQVKAKISNLFLLILVHYSFVACRYSGNEIKTGILNAKKNRMCDVMFLQKQLKLSKKTIPICIFEILKSNDLPYFPV